jgi:hypothetical protein
MAAPVAVSKTTKVPGFKTSVNRIRMVGDKVVKPVLYCGSNAGHGTYLTGQIDGITVEDTNGKPVPFRSIGTLVP